MDNKWALEEHLSTADNNRYWNSAGESARNGKTLTDYVESHLLDVIELCRNIAQRAMLSRRAPRPWKQLIPA